MLFMYDSVQVVSKAQSKFNDDQSLSPQIRQSSSNLGIPHLGLGLGVVVGLHLVDRE